MRFRRRLRACSLLDRPFSALVEDVADPEEQYEKSARSNLNRADHTPLEIAHMVERMNQYRFPWIYARDKSQEVALAYGAGLRVSEVIKLKLRDLDFGKMQIAIRQSKGKRDRLRGRHPGRDRVRRLDCVGSDFSDYDASGGGVQTRMVGAPVLRSPREYRRPGLRLDVHL